MNLETYRAARASALSSSRLAEPRRPRGELEMQARFYAGEFGLAWTGTAGERIEAIHLGAWNREPGPDFVGAALRIDGEEHRGDIELDPEDADWERHGHSANPSFDGVRLHVFFRAGRHRFFTRTSKNTSIPQVLLEGQTRRILERNLTPSHPPPVREGAEKAVVLAAQFRLAQKRLAWSRAEALHGRKGALFQAAAAGLGYKHNKVPFLLVAQRAGLGRASTESGEALLFGIAGFLDAGLFDSGTAGARTYLRGLWDRWWAMRGPEARLVLPADSWNFAGLRPQNHPHRRLAALAALVRDFLPFEGSVASADPRAFLGFLGSLEHPYWNLHSSLASGPMRAPCALIGTQRAADLAANILAPAAHPDRALSVLEKIPAGTPNAKAVKSADWLGLGQKHPLLFSALGQQGLIQIYDDFFPTPAPDVIGNLWQQDLSH